MLPHRWMIRAGGLTIAAAMAALMLATEPHLAIVWDEGYTLGREARLRAWALALENPGRFAAVAGLGAASALERFGRWGQAFLAAALAEGAVSIALMMPVPLSYFSPLVGGLPGASRLGMEPTYYWDGLSRDALDWLNRNTPPGQTVQFASYPTSWLYLHQTGQLRPEILPTRASPPAW